MTPLDRKLWRGLWHIRGQALAIALIVASGVALLIMTRTSMDALSETRDTYYERYEFADVFATLKRAPRRLADQISALPGVKIVDVRIAKFASLEVEGFNQPIIGQVISLPAHGAPRLNRLVLRMGRSVEPGRADEVVISEPFAQAHGLLPGATVTALLNGHKRALSIVGIALSPEFVYAIGPGQLMPDKARFGVLWMGEAALAAAYDMTDAFNSVALSLERGAASETVIAGLDRLLAPYGGIGAYDRADQISNWFVSNEIEQHRNLSVILPSVFLAVAAFLLSTVLARLITTERGEIGLLKAFGYGNLAIAWHYLKLVALIAGLGIVLGGFIGYFLGRYHTELYANLFSFPELIYRPRLGTVGMVALIALAVALGAALGAVRRAAALPPSEALRPPSPAVYRRTWLARSRLAFVFDQPTRIILRQIGRWPLRSFLATVGIAMSVAVLIVAFQWRDSIERIVEVFFFEAQRQTATLGLAEVSSDNVLEAARHLPGVMAVEPLRVVSTRMHNGAISRRQAIEGVVTVPRLSLVHDASGRALELPPNGLVISTALARLLKVGAGDRLWVEVLEGRRPVVSVPVVATFETYIGTPAYMQIAALDRLMGEPGTVNGVHLLVDPAAETALYGELRSLPRVSGTVVRRAAIDTFRGTMARVIDLFLLFFMAFACVLAVGVIYNNARIALSERGRELATLRVLGFSRWQVSYILLGELGLLTAAALPIGCAAGYGLVRLIATSFDTELFRVPMVIQAVTYGSAVAIAGMAAAACAALVRRRLDRLDLIEVLKTRE